MKKLPFSSIIKNLPFYILWLPLKTISFILWMFYIFGGLCFRIENVLFYWHCSLRYE